MHPPLSPNYPLERSSPLSDARAEVLRVLAALDLRHELLVAGMGVVAVKCRLYDTAGERVATGLGKGDEPSAIAGALFEALEHYFLKHHYVELEHLPNLLLAEQSRGVLPGLIASVIRQSREGAIPCVPHDCLSGGPAVAYPLGLFMPTYLDALQADPSLNHADTFDYTRLAEYSSNTGVAIGMNRTEALVHGLLEAVERDAMSRFLADAFLKREPGSLQEIQPDTLPPRLRKLADEVAHKASVAQVRLFTLRNRFNIPTFCAWMDRQVYGLFQVGFGSSLRESHAIERSLYELAQSFIAFTELHEREGAEQRNREILANLAHSRLLQRCAAFDLAALDQVLVCQPVAYQGRQLDPGGDLSAYLSRIVELLEGGGAKAYVAEFTLPIDSPITVTHSYVSESDRFITVMGGRTPLPSAL
jgi:ribosomal protein S12 methylthiotransferase accessory factor